MVDRPVLCLPPATGDLPEQGGVVVCPAATPFRKPIEHAGHIYQQKLIRTYGLNLPEEDLESDNGKSKKEEVKRLRPDSSEAAKSLASKMAVGSDDLYELLELGDKRWHATAEDIKKGFRRISLIYHPDKISHQGEEAKSNSETHFKAVMKAYDILSDKKKRAAYDSIDDVDDSIPTEKDATISPERFYERFGQCFGINSRWSMSNRVPELGEDSTSIDVVNKFYDFWYSFKSWRDFSFDLEYDTDQAECREEKRWMERQNSKHVKSRKLEENARIRRLVDLAYKHDPRLLRIKQEAKAKKDAVKEERRRKAEEVTRLAKEKEEREKLEADKKAVDDKVKRAVAKKQKDAAKQVMRKTRQKLRALARTLALMESEKGLVLVERMCAEGTIESIETAREMIVALPDDTQDVSSCAIAILERAIATPWQPISGNQQVDSEPQQASADSNCKAENSAPNGATTVAPSERRDELPKANGVYPEKKAADSVWTAQELSLLSKGVTKFPGGTRDRWNRLADYVGSRSAEEVLRKVSETRPSKIKAGAAPQAARSTSGSNAFVRFQEKKKGNPVVPQGKPSASASSPATTVPSAAPPPNQPPNKLGFTPKQQRNLEAALKKFPPSEGAARWKRVSKVAERAPEECKERYIELIAYYQAKKAAAK